MTPQRNFAHPHRGERSERAPVITRHIDAKPEPVPAEVPAHVVCYGAFRQPPSRQSPETMKERALAGTPLRLVTRSLRECSPLHDQHHAAGPNNRDGIVFRPQRIPGGHE